MLEPNRTTVWQVGRRYRIQWDPRFRLSTGEYFNNFTRVTILLYQNKRTLLGAGPSQSSPSSQPPSGRSSRSHPQLLLTTIAENYPMALGHLYWEVPRHVLVPGPLGFGHRSVSLGHNNSKHSPSVPSLPSLPPVTYSLWIYPSFFDWPRSCPNCKLKVTPSAPFAIRTAGKHSWDTEREGVCVCVFVSSIVHTLDH